MSRGSYWAWVVGLIVVGGLILTIVRSNYGENAEYVVGRWLGLGIVAIFWALAAFRLRDSGHNEKWALLVLVPVVNLIAIIAIGVPRSEESDIDSKVFDSPF